MYEDAACNNPCGAEPMGCATCPDIFGACTYEDYLDMEDMGWDDRCEHGFYVDDCEECMEMDAPYGMEER